MENIKGRPAVVLRQQDVHSFLVTTFAFDQETARVGEPCRAQLSVTSLASKNSAPVVMDEIKILFETSLKPITLRHSSESEKSEICKDGTLLHKVVLTEEQSKRESIPSVGKRTFKPTVLSGIVDLNFAPDQTRVFEFTIPLRESEHAKALTASFTMTTSSFDLDYIVSFDSIIDPIVHWARPRAPKRIVRADPHKINILPKPPKMDIHFPSLSEQYYTDETIKIELDIFNGEHEDTIAELEVEITSAQSPNPATPFKVRLAKPADAQSKSEEDGNPESTGLGRISASESVRAILELDPIHLQSTYEVGLLLKYTLASDPDTRITRHSAIQLNVESPFEANYEFSPRQDDRPWQSFFSSDGLTIPAKAAGGTETDTLNPASHGLGQKWSLTARYCSFAREILAVESVELAMNTLSETITASTSVSSTSPALPASIQPEALAEAHFDVLTQKLSLDDRRSASLDLSLVLKWRRADGSDNSVPFNTTTLPIPRLLVGSSEPRVLASCKHSPSGSTPHIIHLTYTLENPSLHFLTFSCVMSSSELFAFEGPKSSIVQVLPMSRRSVEFRLMPNVRGEYVPVNLVVTDRYFQKVLRVQPGEGMKGLNERDGVAVWIPEE